MKNIKLFSSSDVDEITEKIRQGWFLNDTIRYINGKPVFRVSKRIN